MELEAEQAREEQQELSLQLLFIDKVSEQAKIVDELQQQGQDGTEGSTSRIPHPLKN